LSQLLKRQTGFWFEANPGYITEILFQKQNIKNKRVGDKD
jgi:hypothetical protein